MKWTSPADLKSQVRGLWDRGLLLSSMVNSGDIFPRRLVLKGPTSKDLSEHFSDVREWISQVSGAAGHYRIEWASVNHRILGMNKIPSEIWIDTMENALGFIGKHRAAKEFMALVDLAREKEPGLLTWLAKRPLRALELAEHWPHLVAITAWMKQNPRPDIYLRQIDLPGVHTKLIEGHRGVLLEMCDLILHSETIDMAQTGVNGFCRRYGFRDKPVRVRFQILDPAAAILPIGSDQDITVTESTFSQLELAVSKVFITENEINFLAFPYVPDAAIIFGAGYGFDHLAGAHWLKERSIYYWGDIDTHGFAILNQLRGVFPDAQSLLMDRQTLLAHRISWGIEDRPERRDLDRLNADEGLLYDELRCNRLGDRIRLEQERIGFDFLVDILHRITGQ